MLNKFVYFNQRFASFTVPLQFYLKITIRIFNWNNEVIFGATDLFLINSFLNYTIIIIIAKRFGSCHFECKGSKKSCLEKSIPRFSFKFILLF